ncbi:MAG: hypothetical protein OXK82_01390 [Deltaproteobacteria bacterium]|nr:hypothetical protein [Deltaproteobacteria bacterium]
MVTQTASKTEHTEQALRDRIHQVFCGDTPPSESAGASPSFWVEPTEDQKNNVVLNLHDSIVLSEDMRVATDPADVAADEHRWLNAPHVDLDGRSPEQMLTGDQQSRQRLEVFVTAVETAIRGSFR